VGDSVGLFREDKMSTWLGNAGGGTGKSYVIIHFMGMELLRNKLCIYLSDRLAACKAQNVGVAELRRGFATQQDGNMATKKCAGYFLTVPKDDSMIGRYEFRSTRCFGWWSNE